MFNQKLFAACSNAYGISGHEGAVRSIIRQELGELSSIRSLPSGNMLAEKKGPAPRVMLAAHMDEIGFMVQGITADGYLPLVPIGGWWNHTLPSQRVIVRTRCGKLIPGQIGSKPPHLLPESQRKQVLPDDALFVDVGASCAKEVQELGITIGCAVIPDVELQQLHIPHRWMGKAFDNRVGVYAMIEVMRRLATENLPCTLIGAGTVQEEVGTRGARAIPATEQAELTLVLEGPPADDTMGMPGACRTGELGKGVQVRLFDPTHITPPALADWVMQVATEEQIPCQWAVRRTGGTDAAASYPNWEGKPAIVLGVPVRYIHSHNGILDDRDIEAMIQLACALARRFDEARMDQLLDPDSHE